MIPARHNVSGSLTPPDQSISVARTIPPMPAETLTFSCVHCQTRLTVRAALAGVTGPCPSCRGTITAPPASAESPDLALAPEGLPAVEAVPSPVSRNSSATTSEVGPSPSPGSEEDDTERDLLPSGGPRIRPEPRNLPDRPQIIPIPARHSTSDRHLSNRGATIHDATRRPFRLLHALLPAAYVALAVGVVGSLLYFYAPGSPGQRMKQATRPLVVQGPAKGTPPAPRTAFVPAAQVPESPEADEDEDRSIAPDSSDDRSASPAIAAYDMLESFLQAEDAASRLNQVEPAATEEELAATLLGGKLPPFFEIAPDPPRQQPDEEMTEFPYRVSFVAKDAPNHEFGILVRQRGSQPPRVFLPAFLDLVGGRLSTFTAKPNTLPPARFHVYLAPIAECYEKDIPGADRKFTLKLMASPVGKETARAYAANASRLRQLVDDPNYPIRWGMLRRATVSVRWNHQEDPARPFLELVDITSPNWNP
jgi:hypothetical protein